MALPSPPVAPAPLTRSESGLKGDIDTHVGDQTNAHVNGTPTAGQVPTYQGGGVTQWATPPGSAGGAPVGSATPKPAAGAGSAGTATSAAREDHVHPGLAWSASDVGFKGWTFDGLAATGTVALTPGTIYTAVMKVEQAAALASVMLPISAAGSGLTSSYVGIYDMAGNQLAVSADQGSGWTSAGNKTVAMSAATASIPAGTMVRVAVLAVGTTGPSVRVYPSATSAAVNLGMTRYGTAGTAQTTLPATLGALTNGSNALWLAAA